MGAIASSYGFLLTPLHCCKLTFSRSQRITLDDDVTRRASPSFDSGRPSSSKEDHIREQIKSFFENPLMIFGRTYRPFCWKDGAAVYWCESGAGIEEIPLVVFAQRVRLCSFSSLLPSSLRANRFLEQYLDVTRNGSMSVANYAARFELGLTNTVRLSSASSFPCSR